MVECGLTEREITISTLPIVKNAIVRYGTANVTPEEIRTGEDGKTSFCWLKATPVYVSVQKTNYIFSDSFVMPRGVSWGASSEWYKISRWSNKKTIYPFEKPPELPPVPELPPAPELLPVPEVIEEVIEGVCRTEADPTVPAALSAYFPVSIRNARWICDGISENITGTGIIRIKGSDIAQIPIRNGYGSPINLGTIPEFKDLLKELVG